MWLAIVSVLSALGVGWANSKDMLVEHSMADQNKVSPQQDLGKLFSELGIEQSGHVRLNPCFDIGELTEKYCSPHSIKRLLSENAFIETEEQLLRKMLMDDSACEQVSIYIDRICHQENFKKIFKHFALRK